MQYLTHFWKYQVIVTLIIWHMAYGIIDFISQQTNCSNHEFFDWCHFVKHTQIIHIMNYLTYQIRANYSNHELFGKTDRPIGRWTDLRVTVRPYCLLSTDRPSGRLTDRPLVSLISQNWHLSSAKKRFLTPFFCQKKFLSFLVKFIEKK